VVLLEEEVVPAWWAKRKAVSLVVGSKKK